MNKDIDLDKIRAEAEMIMQYMKGRSLNIGEAYCISIWIKSAIQKAQPEIRKLNPAIREAQQKVFGSVDNEE